MKNYRTQNSCANCKSMVPYPISGGYCKKSTHEEEAEGHVEEYDSCDKWEGE